MTAPDSTILIDDVPVPFKPGQTILRPRWRRASSSPRCQQGVSGARWLRGGAVAPVVALQAQCQAPQGRELSTLAPLRALRCHSTSNSDPQPQCRKFLNRNDNLAYTWDHDWTPIEVFNYRQFYCHRNRLALSKGGVKVRRRFTANRKRRRPASFAHGQSPGLRSRQSRQS